MRLRRLAVTAVAALAITAVSACGSGADNADNADGSGGGSTSSAPTTADDSSGGSTGSGGSGSDVSALTAQSIGAAMAKAAIEAGSAHMEITAGSAVGKVAMTGDIGGMGQRVDDLQLEMKMKIPNTGTAEMRIVDSAFYMQIPGVGMGSKWLKVPLDDPNNPLGSLYSQFAQFTDPEAIKASYSAFNKFTDKGDETVDGVEAHHYTVVVDTAKSLKASHIREIGGIPLKKLLASMPKQTTSDLWLDGDNHIVKMSSSTVAGTYEVHYSDWGTPVHVTAPPKNQVAQLPSSSL